MWGCVQSPFSTLISPCPSVSVWFLGNMIMNWCENCGTIVHTTLLISVFQNCEISCGLHPFKRTIICRHMALHQPVNFSFIFSFSSEFWDHSYIVLFVHDGLWPLASHQVINYPFLLLLPLILLFYGYFITTPPLLYIYIFQFSRSPYIIIPFFH